MQAPDNDIDATSDASDNDHEGAETTTSTDDTLWEKMEDLKEKRASVRLKALTYFVTQLQKHQHVDLILERADTLLTYTASLVKKSSSGEEASLACQVISLAALSFRAKGHDGHDLLLNQWPLMQTLMKNTARPLEARVAAVCATGLMCWVDLLCDTLEDSQLAPVLTQFEALVEPQVEPDLVVAALDMLALLLTCEPEAKLAGSLFKKYAPVCSGLLTHPILEVKQSAGCLLALLQEAAMTCEQADTVADVEEGVDIDAIIERLQELSTDSSRMQTKKQRAKQKSFFRDILRTVEDCEAPVEKLEIMTINHEFEGWRTVLQLKCMRGVLGSGLTQQLVKNSLLVETFDVQCADPDTNENVTKQQKKAGRIARQTQAKGQYQDIAKKRKQKMQIRNAHDED